MAAQQGRGVSTTLRAPPSACGPTRAWHAKGGAGRGRAHETHAGSCSHTVRDGRRFTCAPRVYVALGFCAAPSHGQGVGGQGEGASPHEPCTEKEGGVRAAPPACPLPFSRLLLLPRSRASSRPYPNGGTAFSAPHSHG